MKRCNKCVMADTRPRIALDDEGVCGPCRYWDDKENAIDWANRKQELEDLCDKYRTKDGNYDCIVPVSGGKDSGYVAWKLKHEYGMHPLTVTFAGNNDTEVGRMNLKSFIDSGFDNILVTPNGVVHKKLIRKAFVEFGDPFFWLRKQHPILRVRQLWLTEDGLRFDILNAGGRQTNLLLLNVDALVKSQKS